MLAAQAAHATGEPSLGRAGKLSLGRRLFPLLPEDAHDRQPLLGAGGRIALVADLRLDNREELAEALGLGPHEAAHMADSDLLLRVVERWGEEGIDRLLGDYAFAWFDSEAGELRLVRDPLGQRPLFWYRGRGFVAFASMPSGLHALDEVPKAPDPDSLARFLALVHQAGSASFFDGIHRVEPGHVVTISASGSRSRRYWQPERRRLRLASFEDYVEAYREQLDRAVERRLRGVEGIVATHLSGGWDSGAVTATAARLLAPSGGRVAAFTAVPASPAAGLQAPPRSFVDEGPLAAETAALFENVDHRLIPGSDRSPLAELRSHLGLFERPPFNLCNHVWLAQIRSAARAEGARILLTGEIGNWTISASPSTLLADLVRRGRWGAWWREARAMRRQGRVSLKGLAASSFAPWVPASAWRRLKGLSSTPGLNRRSALNPALWERFGPEQEARELGPAARPKDNFERTLAGLRAMDFGEYRKAVLGGWGIDKRDATADRRLIEFCLSLPTEMLLHDGVRRPLARAALADRLPAAVLDESRKGYQAADWGEALTRDLPAIRALIEEIAADPLAASLIDIDLLRRLVRDWPPGGWDDPRIIAQYRVALLQALSVGQFVLSQSR